MTPPLAEPYSERDRSVCLDPRSTVGSRRHHWGFFERRSVAGVPRAPASGHRGRRGPNRRATRSAPSMSDYDPRTETGIPTEPVGSLPRPDQAAGRLRGLRRGQDRPASSWRPSRTRPSRTRSSAWRRPARRSSPTASSAGRASPPTRSPTRWPAPAWPTTSAGGGQYFAIFADGHNRQLPRLTGGPFRYKTYAADTLKKSIGVRAPSR